ncbi:universal stress protein [Streptomyces sp. NPDC046866]|uniref:universal stress protein n=1 Tax=Streptomyces sp. NPDC046866 TaxID=3154921 RepID=UPI00345183F3
MSRMVVVGLDGSPASLAAAEWAAHEARLRRLPLKLLHAVEHCAPPYGYASPAGTSPPVPASTEYRDGGIPRRVRLPGRTRPCRTPGGHRTYRLLDGQRLPADARRQRAAGRRPPAGRARAGPRAPV